MAKNRISKKQRKGNNKRNKKHNSRKIDEKKINGEKSGNEKRDERQKSDDILETVSPHATLCTLAPLIAEKKLLEPIHTIVQIPQKKVFYRPTDKLAFLTLGIISGTEAVYDINQTFRVDKGLLNAFGYQQCADQSVIVDTLNAVTGDNILEMEKALKVIWDANNLTSSILRSVHEEGKLLTIDIDLSGQEASKRAEGSKKGYFSGKRNAYGRQLSRALVSETGEILAESLYTGNRVSWDHNVFKEMLSKIEYMLSISGKPQEGMRNSILLRLDSGFGTDKNINYALWRGYELLVKVRCIKRARKLSKSVTEWVDIPNDSDNNRRQAGWVTTPHRYGKKTKQLAIRKTTKKGYTYSVLVSTDMDADMIKLVRNYDARGGAPESSFCQESQGLCSLKRRKNGFVAQQMLMLLNQLSHNMIRWFQHWLIEAVELRAKVEEPESLQETEPVRVQDSLSSLPKVVTGKVMESSLIVKTLKERGMKRFVHQILSISGKVVMRNQRICKVILNPLYPMINRIVTAFRILLEPYGIAVSLDEV